MRPTSREGLQKQCDDWNRDNEIGAIVKVRMDSGEIRETKTRTEAQVLGSHSAVVWLEGITGCYLLERVRAI